MHKAFIIFFAAVALSGCASRQGPSDGQFQGTAIKLRSTAQICEHIQKLRANGEPEEIEQSMGELRQRGFADLAAEEVIDAPKPGLKDSEVLCLWGAPGKITKELTMDGGARETWIYSKRTGVFKRMTQTLVFNQGVLMRVGEPVEQ